MSRFITAFLPHQPEAAAWTRLERCAALMPAAVGQLHRHTSPSGPLTLWRGKSDPNLHESDGVLVVMDGHFLNRAELPGGKSDAESFFRLYRRAGIEKAAAAVRGDYALAIHDSSQSVTHLLRDRIGVVPLYYVAPGTDGAWGAASMSVALAALPGVGFEPNQDFVDLFAGSHYRTIDNNREASPFRNVRQVPAGHVVTLRGTDVAVRPYWELTEEPELAGSEEELAEEYRSLFQRAVKERLAVADNPAFTLSGGMDSSSVLATSASLTGRPQAAFSSVYSDPTYDERDEIRAMLYGPVSPWFQVPVEGFDLFPNVRELVRIHGEPVATATWLSHYQITRTVAEQGYGSLFGGLGGDELNAGEFEYFFFHFADLRQAGRTADLDHEIAQWAHHHNHPVFQKSPAVAFETMSRVVDEKYPGLCRPDMRRVLRYRKALQPERALLDSFTPNMPAPFSSYLKSRTWQDIFYETAPCCLRAEDRQSAARGLDHFLPFFDDAVVRFMFRVSGSMKIRDGITKRILRTAMQGTLPEETRLRVKKTGWNAPAHAWFSGEALSSLRDLLASRRFRERGIYDPAQVKTLLEEHLSIVSSGAARDNHMMFFWQLVNMEEWLSWLDDLAAETKRAEA